MKLSSFTLALITGIASLLLFSNASAQTAFDSALANQTKSALKIIRITPTGTDVTTSGRQIVFKFNQPMVAIGQMQAKSDEIPVDIKPAVQCEWRWLETTSLSCQIARDAALRNATEYTITVRPGFTALGGASLKQELTHSFITQRPKINSIRLEHWAQADKPLARVSFNQPVSKASLKKALRFIGPDSSYASEITILNEDNRLNEEVYLKSDAHSDFVLAPRLYLEPDSEAEISEFAKRALAADEARRVWRIQPRLALPRNRKIDVSLQAGLIGIEGQLSAKPVTTLHTFTSLPRFEFLGIECLSSQRWQSINVAPTYAADTVLREPSLDSSTDTEKVEACDPQNLVSLRFSTPVSYRSAGGYIRFTPDLAGGDENYDPWSSRNSDYYISSFFRQRFNNARVREFVLPVPEVLKAHEQYSLRSLPGLTDEVGRSLSKPIDMAFLTAHRRPALAFEHSASVLETGVDSELPAYVTNLEQLKVENYTLTTAKGFEGPYTFSKPLADVQDVAYRVPVGVRNLLGDKSGVVVGQLSSVPVARHYDRDQTYRFWSQVTPFQVHLKLGHFNSYAWVTELATGLPVADATVSIELERLLNLQPQRDGGDLPELRTTDKKGLVALPGLLDIDPELNYVNAYRYDQERWVVKVKKGDDVAFLPLDSTYETWSQVWPYLKRKDAYMHAWGTTAQGVYKAGDTVQYKLYVRGQNNQHWIRAPQGEYTLKVIDPKGQVVHEVNNVSLNAFSAFDGEFSTSTTAAVGWYDFQLTFKNQTNTYTRNPMRVLVSDFTPSPFKAGNDLNGDQFQVGDTLRVNSYAKMHAGGPYADAQVRVTAMLSPRSFSSDHPSAKGFRFSTQDSRTETLHQSSEQLNNQGERATEFKIGEQTALYGRIQVETAVRDDRGKYVASSSGAEFIGRDRFIGLKQDQWVLDVGEVANVQYLVVGPKGNPVAHDKVDFLIEYQVTRAARVKGAGNAYLTQYTQSWETLSRCQQAATLKPLSCKFTPVQPGSHRITATIKDTKGRELNNILHTWVVGEGAMVWNESSANRIELIADKKTYAKGDVAKFLVKNPYPGAQALITAERYGVLRTWQQVLKGSTPIIEVPILGDDYPGFYLSVVVASPRVAQPLGEGDVDLGKPAFKMGYAKVVVRDDAKAINVKLKTDRKVYKPRDTVQVSIKAKPKTGKRKAMELAVVVLDEAVFDLNRQGKSYYDPYKGFNKLDQLGVGNYNLLMRLIGRQKFEKKGANPGGGGGEGSADLRNLLKFVAYWNPSIELDKRGRSKFEFELPDNLTGWRVLAMVVDKEERMGLGDANFKVNRPTELRPVMPNQLTRGDTVDAGFSVMNRTNKARTLSVELRASGSALIQPMRQTQQVTLEPFERKRVWLPLTAANAGELAFFAKAGDAKDADAMEHHVLVKPRYVVQTQASYGTTTQAAVTEPIRFPDGIVPNVGGVSVVLSPSVIDNVTGAFRYMRDYPYRCWEQRISMGLAASQYQNLKDYTPADFSWHGSDTLAQNTLNDAAQFQAPNGGMTYWVNRNDYVSPYLSAYTAMAFVWLREQGWEIPEQVEQKLHSYLKGYLRRGDAEQVFNTQLSIRAVALAALAARGAIDADELARYQPHVAQMNLFGKAHFLQAAASLNLEDEKLGELSNSLLAQSVQSGGKFSFQETVGNEANSMLHSSMRTNCAILSSLLQASQASKAIFSLVGDVPFKQVRAITQTRGQRDHWSNTQENVFCMNALIDYSELYEDLAPNMSLAAVFEAPVGVNAAATNLQRTDLGDTQFTSLRDKAVTLKDQGLPVKPGFAGRVEISKRGEGRFYYSVRAEFAKTDEASEAINAGIEVHREYAVQRDGEWIILRSPMQLEKGELVRVDLFVSTAGPRNYVVIDDPVPGGLEPVNRDLATSSVVDANHANAVRSKRSWFYQRDGWRRYGRYGYSFYHQELRHDSARFYSDYLPAGDYHLSYTAQAIASGSFAVKPLKVEEMYDPDVFGLGLPARLNVEQVDD